MSTDNEHINDPEARFVRVETAARILGISRGLAYRLARQYLETGGGLCCVRLGNRILVPKAWLDVQTMVGC